MKSFSVVSGKGGAGKTVFSAAVGFILAQEFVLADERSPSVLLVDMDLHIRGLSFLLYESPAKLEEVELTTFAILNSAETNHRLDELLASPQFQAKGMDRLFIIPSTNFQDPIDWAEVHKWHASTVRERVIWLIQEAEQAGFDFVIIDTRAGPDNLSLGAALATDYTFVMVERDIVSSRAALTMSGEISHLQKEYKFTTRDGQVPQFVFTPSKVLKPFSLETRKTLRDFTFTQDLPFDIAFLRKFSDDAHLAIRHDLLTSKYSRHVIAVISTALDQLGVSHTHTSPSLLGVIDPNSTSVRVLNYIPPSVTLIIGTIFTIMSTIEILLDVDAFDFSNPNLLLSLTTMTIGMIFLILSGIHAWIVRRV